MNDSIFTPKYVTTPVIKYSIDDIKRDAWLVANMLIMPKHEAWIQREVAVERASGTTRIEGASLDESAVKNLMKKGSTGVVSEDERANLNALQAYEFIDYLSDQPDIPIDELVIRQINREFLRGASPVLTPGVYRKGENTVGNYIPPNQGDVPSLMRAFALWLREDDHETDPILKAGIAHIHLVAIHPFWDGNGRTARALATLILQRLGYNFKKLLSLEKYFADVKDSYFASIERTLSTEFPSEYDVTPWLEFFTLALKMHIGELVTKLTKWHQMMDDLHKKLEPVGFNDRQIDGTMYAFRTGQICRADYIEITGVSPVTASRDLARLVKKGLLTPKGDGRSRIYLLTMPPTPAPKREPEAKQLSLLGEGTTQSL